MLYIQKEYGDERTYRRFDCRISLDTLVQPRDNKRYVVDRCRAVRI